MTDEEVVMKLIVPAGNAKAHAIEAIASARGGDVAHARELLDEADRALVEAHEHQSDEIRRMLNGGTSEGVSLIMVHGQDHLMNAITTIDLAKQIVALIADQKGAEGA